MQKLCVEDLGGEGLPRSLASRFIIWKMVSGVFFVVYVSSHSSYLFQAWIRASFWLPPHILFGTKSSHCPSSGLQRPTCPRPPPIWSTLVQEVWVASAFSYRATSTEEAFESALLVTKLRAILSFMIHIMYSMMSGRARNGDLNWSRQGKNALPCTFDFMSNNDLFCSDGAIHIDTPFSCLLAKPLVMVAGMTPTTVEVGFVGAFPLDTASSSLVVDIINIPHCKDFITNTDGLKHIEQLTVLPCLPYDFANSVTSDSLAQVMRTMRYHCKWDAGAFAEARSCFIVRHKRILGKYWVAVDVFAVSWYHLWLAIMLGRWGLALLIGGFTTEKKVQGNQSFWSLITQHICITLLSDVFATSELGYMLMGDSSQDMVPDLGTLHHVCIWEDIILKAGLTLKGIDALTSA